MLSAVTCIHEMPCTPLHKRHRKPSPTVIVHYLQQLRNRSLLYKYGTRANHCRAALSRLDSQLLINHTVCLAGSPADAYSQPALVFVAQKLGLPSCCQLLMLHSCVAAPPHRHKIVCKAAHMRHCHMVAGMPTYTRAQAVQMVPANQDSSREQRKLLTRRSIRHCQPTSYSNTLRRSRCICYSVSRLGHCTRNTL
jgi:hypothetical protein